MSFDMDYIQGRQWLSSASNSLCHFTSEDTCSTLSIYLVATRTIRFCLQKESKQTIDIDFQLHASYHMQYENCDGYRYLDRKREK